MSDSSDDEVYQQDEHHYDNDPDSEDEVLASDDGEDSFNGTDSDDDDGEGDYDEGDDQEDDDDDFVGKTDKHSRFKIEKQKDDMASDIEDEDEENYLPNSQAWGQDKKLYYSTDFVDKDYRSQKGKEEDLAKYEEEEALRIQKRMLEAYDKPSNQQDPFRPDQDYHSDDEDLQFNIQSMTAEEKRKLLQQESPELLFLVEKFEQYVQEINETLEPLIEGLIGRQHAPESSGLRYLKTRYAVLLNYTTNLSFYFAMMSSDDKDMVKSHPVMKQLFQGQKLIEELDMAYVKNGKRLAKEIPHVMEALAGNKSLQFLSTDEIAGELSLKTKKTPPAAAAGGKKADVEFDDDSDDDMDELDDGDIGEWPIDDQDEEEDAGDKDEVGGEEDEEEKRGITYEMEKNKGLIPKRQKEQRNPRVKYRKKFEKATVRRKGQVRAPKKPLKPYPGEITGINTRVSRVSDFKRRIRTSNCLAFSRRKSAQKSIQKCSVLELFSRSISAHAPKKQFRLADDHNNNVDFTILSLFPSLSLPISAISPFYFLRSFLLFITISFS